MIISLVLGLLWASLPGVSLFLYSVSFALFRDKAVKLLSFRTYVMLGRSNGLTGLLLRLTAEPPALAWRFLGRIAPSQQRRISGALVISPARKATVNERFIHRNRAKVIGVASIAGCFGGIALGAPAFAFTLVLKAFYGMEVIDKAFVVVACLLGFFSGVSLF